MIHKSHSKNDLVDIINIIGIPIVFSHQNNKRDIQDKLKEYLKKNVEKKYEENVYKIHDNRELLLYLKNTNPKKTLNVKDKNVIMTICKKIITYCNNGYIISKSLYNTEKEIEDDMDWIKSYGDIPSVRRCCKLMNSNPVDRKKYNPVISPQIQKQIDDKKIHKKVFISTLQIKREKIILSFD